MLASPACWVKGLARWPIASRERMIRRFLLLLTLLFSSTLADAAESLKLDLRSRGKEGQVSEKKADWDVGKTALIICDMWDTHTCPNSASRVNELAPRVNEFAKAMRSKGALIIHCPSDVTKFYEGTSQRKLAQSAPVVTPKVPLLRWCYLDPKKEAPLPIDDTDGGCDCPRTWKKGDPYPWTRQHAAIEIAEGDAITDSAEAYYLMRQRGIENVLVSGVHLNMCVLGRPFAIRQLAAQGLNVALVRDLTDTMYNPAQRPWVNHFAGTELMVQHVEKYWCPTIASNALLGGEPFRFAGDRAPHVVFLVGDSEYETGTTVPMWARAEIEPRGVRCTYLVDNPKADFDFAKLAELQKADALFVSIKRRGLPPAQMAAIRAFAESGKPVIGIRTASHAFDLKKPGAGESVWPTFDRDIFGGWYQGHYGKGPATLAKREIGEKEHPVLAGIPEGELRFASHLYKCRELAAGTKVLLKATLEGQAEVSEPVAWVYEAAKRRGFYTSLGAPEDFAQPAFRRLLLNATLWAVGEPIPPEAEGVKTGIGEN
jgi:nicotinamidase-related amidase/type 1 glutamine amidotransferase